MIVHRFVKWCETANARQRSEGVAILGRAFAEQRIPAADLDAATAALMLAAEDPSPKVRMALARTLAACARTPRSIVAALCEDNEEIASLIVSLSPLLADSALIHLAAGGRIELQTSIASRAGLTAKVAAAIAEVGEQPACLALVDNRQATIAALSLRRLADRFGEDACVRQALLERGDLPADVRQRLLLEIGRTLSATPLVLGALGASRTNQLVLETCDGATANLAHDLSSAEMPMFVEHLRRSGQLSTAFLIRMVCAGNIDLFAASLVALSGRSERRVRAIVVDGQEGAFHALVTSCGLPPAAAPLLRTAVQVWKEAVRSHPLPEIEDVASHVMMRLAAFYREHEDEDGFGAIAALLGRLEAESFRDAAHGRRRRLAMAA